MSTLMAENSDRLQRHKEKVSIVLAFLKQEIYTDVHTLMLLLGYKKRQPLDRLLIKLIELGVIKKHVFQFPTGQCSLWGITELGLAQVSDGIDEDFQPFDPYRVKFVTLNHRLMNQRIRIHLEKKGWTNWHNGDRHSFKQTYTGLEHRPDATMMTPKGHRIAFEAERTFKTVPRYRSIMKSHITAQQKKYWHAVFYVVESQEAKVMFNKLLDKIEYVRFQESKYQFEPYRQKLIRVFTLDELPFLEL